MQMTPLRRRRPTLDHPFFGRITMASVGVWETDLVLPGLREKIGIVMPAPETGPSAAQSEFCRELLRDLDTLFVRCRPVFSGEFEQWTGRPFPSDWRTEFTLVGLELPVDGNETRSWNVCYFVDAANHYFTAFFENGRVSYLTVDG